MNARLVLACLSSLAAVDARSADITVSLGLADPHDGRSARVAEFSAVHDIGESAGWIRKLGATQYEVMAGWIESRPEPGLDRSTRFVGLGVRRSAGRWFAGAGVALVDNLTDALSSRYQFVTSGGVTIGPATLTLRHLSNAGLRGPNRGETYLTIGHTW